MLAITRVAILTRCRITPASGTIATRAAIIAVRTLLRHQAGEAVPVLVRHGEG